MWCGPASVIRTSANVPGRKGAASCEREVHELVLTGAPSGDRRILLARPFDQHFLDATDAGAVLRQGAALDHDAETFEAFGHHVRRGRSRRRGRPPRCRGGARRRRCTRCRTRRRPRHRGCARSRPSVSPGKPTMRSVVTARSAMPARAHGQPLEVALAGVAPVHRRQRAIAIRPAAADAGARTPPASRPSPRWSRAEGPSGAGW